MLTFFGTDLSKRQAEAKASLIYTAQYMVLFRETAKIKQDGARFHEISIFVCKSKKFYILICKLNVNTLDCMNT